MLTVDSAATNARRVLVRAPNWLGDAVMALPAMAALRAGFADRTLVLAAPASVAPLFQEITPAAPDEVLVVDRSSEAAALRGARADLAVLLPNSFRSAWVGRTAGIPERWGYKAHGRSLLLTRGVPRPRVRGHQSEYFRHLVASFGFDVPGTPPRVEITAATQRRVETLLATHGIARSTPLVGLAPGAAYGHAKRWPPDRVAGLITRLAEHGATSILVGAGGDRDAAREVEAALPPRVPMVNLVGRTDLRLLAGLLASCHAFVSNDSGAMHLAAAVGIPVTAIFGPTNERETAPLGDHDVIVHQVFCRPCMLRDCPIDHRCMRGIAVDTVFEAVTRRLAVRHAGPESHA